MISVVRGDGDKSCTDCGITQKRSLFPLTRSSGKYYPLPRCWGCKRALERRRSSSKVPLHITRKPRPAATCHPDRPHRARGLCEECYLGAHNRRYYDEHSEEQKARALERYRANPQRSHENSLKWKKRHPEKVRGWKAAHYASNVERYKQRAKEWRQANPGAWKAILQARRGRKRNARGAFTAGQLRARFDYFGRLCAYCRGPAETIDHVVPLSRGGTNWPANLRPACRSCNSKKHNKTLVEWLAIEAA